MSDIVNADVTAILELEAACARFAAAVADRLPDVDRELRQVGELLADRRDDLRGKIRRLNDEIDSADEDEDTGPLQRRIEDAREEQARLRRRSLRLEEASSAYTREAHKVALLAGGEVPRARESLRGSADDLKAYFAASLGGNGGRGSSGGGGQSAAAASSAASSAAASAEGIAPVGLFDLPRMPLPEGYVWVPIQDVDRAPDRGGFVGEPVFEKASREEMVRGFAALQTVVLPAIAGLGAEGGAAWCAAHDQQTGRPAEEGVQRVFDAFFGKEPIYLTRGRNAALFDVTNGKHRLHVAAELGWPAVPARVSDLRTP